jgi:uncharacterized protein with NAD-binding domain and iron-sulfur cluster
MHLKLDMEWLKHENVDKLAKVFFHYIITCSFGISDSSIWIEDRSRESERNYSLAYTKTNI